MKKSTLLIILVVVGVALSAGLGLYLKISSEPMAGPYSLPGGSTTPSPAQPSAAQQATQQKQTTAAVQTGITKSPYEGQMIRSMENGPDKGKVFLIWDGLKRWIQTPATLDAYGGWDLVTTKGISNSTINSIPNGPSIS